MKASKTLHVWAGLLVLCGMAHAADIASPGGTVKASLSVAEDGRLTWAVRRGEALAIQASPAGIVLEGSDLGQGVRLGQPQVGMIQEQYPWRGIKSTAVNHCRTASFPVTHIASGAQWTIDVRVFDDGVAFRYRVPGSGRRRVNGEATAWTLPAGSVAWYQTNTADYEGEYQAGRPEQIPLQAGQGDTARPVYLGPPLTAEVPGGLHVMISEANLRRYSGMSLRPTGTGMLKAAFDDDPDGFVVDGAIVTPWRITVVTGDLNGLVNTDMIHNLCDKPDPAIFPDGMRTNWIKPGRALVTWCVFGNDGAQWHRQKWFVDKCAAMKCEYLLVDGGWRTEKWGFLAGGGDLWARLRELCEYGATRKVNIVVWNSFPEGRDDGPGLTDPAARREFMRRCKEAGAKGVKIDFFNSESKATIEAQEDLLQLSAEHRLLINFHGANKPTGLLRTWPNQVTQEGIREQEFVLWSQLPLEHYTALPFTRMVAGHADFLPTYVRKQYLKNTTAVFQMATAIVANSSFLCWPDHPDDYLNSPFLDLIRAMPVVWDETRVLEGSRIGHLAAIARRSGEDWYVGVINGRAEPMRWSTDLTFLGEGRYEATVYRDRPPEPENVNAAAGVWLARDQRLEAKLSGGGGFVAWIRRAR